MKQETAPGTRQLRGLDRLGDLLVPGSANLPSFSQSGAARNLPRLLVALPAANARDLHLLLTVLGWVPAVAVRAALVALLAYRGANLVLRTAQFGVRGLAYGLYYGDPAMCAALGYTSGMIGTGITPAHVTLPDEPVSQDVGTYETANKT